MREVNMSASDVLSHMKNGAKLYRGFGDRIELRADTGIFLVPLGIFDALIDEHRIFAEGGVALGFYHLAE
jgi:hypothetical protein